MKSLLPRYAGVVAAIIAIALVMGVYAMFGTVDLIFQKDGYEIGRQENVSLFTEIELEPGSTYCYEGEIINEDQSVVKNDIPLCLIVNAITFNWDQEANDFVIEVK
jgi:hypothetical protein